MKRSASDRSCSKRVSERARPGTALRITAVRRLTVRTDRRTQLVDITRLVEEALDGADGAGAALVYVPHTTAGVTINESADPAVARDIEAALERLVDDGWPWQHVDDPDGPNAPSHVRASLLGPQVLVPVEGGKLALGRWQGIFFCELDGPRERTVLVTPLS
jgi:secondary thiamine-phosphate synthase enzyme